MKIVCKPTPRFKRFFIEQWVEFYGYHCAYCTGYCENDRTIDHIIPISKGGRNQFINMVLACRKCNEEKANKMPEEFRTLMLQPIQNKHKRKENHDEKRVG
jgi:5-methylcytosine-specific restriction endonuclease McrA